MEAAWVVRSGVLGIGAEGLLDGVGDAVAVAVGVEDSEQVIPALIFDGADVRSVDPGEAALVENQVGHGPGTDGRGAGEQGDGWSGAAVVAERTEARIDIDEVVQVDLGLFESGPIAVADQGV